MKLVFYLLLALGICFTLPDSSFCQKRINDIDFNRIPQKKIRNYLLLQKEKIENFSEIVASSLSDKDIENFAKMKQQYVIDENPQVVWDSYVSVCPTKSWNGKILSFGLLCSKFNDFIMYHDDQDFSGISPGQVYYLNLKLLKGLYNMAVGFEVLEVDYSRRVIRFSYLEDGKSKGQQVIQFHKTREGKTRVIHDSFYKSSSSFRDKYLYPLFHRQIVDEFHENMLIQLLLHKKAG
ncbi:MAG: hypothetical protein ACOCWG_05495 [bacterium]